ncbi:MAG: hypothetical protein M3Y31_04600, partial [Gemmatimonadota bacterium]|nr:hypothetical protein [Gemmatimonadota bacterium]
MRAGKARLPVIALIALLGLAAPRQAGGVAVQQDSTPAPRALPAGDLVVSLDDLDRPLLIENQLLALGSAPEERLAVTVPDGRARLGDFSIGAGQSLEGHLLVLRGTANVYGRIDGNLVTVDGDAVLHPGAVVTGDVLALRGQVRDLGGEVTGETRSLGVLRSVAPALAGSGTLSPAMRTLRNLAGVAGVFLSLAIIAMLVVFFGRHNLEVVSDTVSHSFGRALVTGLLAQLLMLPTFGMLVIGLIISVVGVLLLPFGAAVFVLLGLVAIVGGFLAVSAAMGETWTRRRMAQGVRIESAGAARYLTVGLGAVAVLWLAWALLGWIPVAGAFMLTAAVVVTWMMATVGFGATLLSRAGIREN